MLFYPENTAIAPSPQTKEALTQAMHSKKILEAKAISCDANKNLHFNLGELKGIIPKEECVLNYNENTVRDIAILSRVGKKTCFVVKDIISNSGESYALLSRKQAQEQCTLQYINNLKSGDIISAKITHLENFGAFCDIGCGISALLPIDCMSVSRISSAYDRFYKGQNIFCAVKSKDEHGRLVLSTKELFGTWLENADKFHIGQTVIGVVRSIESYGVFIELTPNLTGLAEHTQSVKCGQCVSVFIKNIQPEKMKIKLSILQTVEQIPTKEYEYTKKSGHISRWLYSTKGCTKFMQTVFDENSSLDYNETYIL